MNELIATKPDNTRHIGREISAGLVVFLVALPLCLGIALASGAPLFSGIIAGIIGGLLITPISGSPLSVSGPAAGLAVIVAEGIKTCDGNFSLFCGAVVLAGFLQLVFGLLHLGNIAEFVPSSVIKGMLAGIGIVIVLKQIPHALGQDSSFEGELAFQSLVSGENTASAIYQAMQVFSLTATVIALVSLIIIFVWDKVVIYHLPKMRIIPSALLVVVSATLIHEGLRAIAPAMMLEPSHLVQLPIPTTFGEWGRLFAIPKVQSLNELAMVVPVAVTIAIIASLETLLSVEAVDKIDPLKRISNTSKELVAQGAGNIASGLIGGLPITAVIVRSSANVYAGGRTKIAGFTHGVFLLLAVIFIPALLNRIPLASLAAILIVIGIKLASPSLFRSVWHRGPDQFIPFAGTILGVIFSDLLKGVLIGLALGLFFVFRRHRSRGISVISREGTWMIRFNKDLSFIHRAELKDALLSIPNNVSVLIDGSAALSIDPDIQELLENFAESAAYRQIALELRSVHMERGFED